MDRTTSAAALVLALVLAMLAGQASAQEGTVVNMWPKTGAWITILTGRAGGGLCSTVTSPQKTGTGDEEVSFGFEFDAQETHFHLRLKGAPPLDPPALKMEASGAVVADMPVLQRMDKDGGQELVADIPGDRFVRLVEPRLVGKDKIEIRAGERTYVLPHDNFVRTIDNLSACDQDAHGARR